MKRLIVLLIVALLIAPSAGSALAQGGGDDDIDDVCPAIVEAALAAVEDACGGAGRDEACYGHPLVDADTHPGAAAVTFAAVGDLAPVAELARLQTHAMDTAAGTWGVALMRLRADLPEALPGQNVTLLLFGDAAILDAAPSASAGGEPLLVTATEGVNLRSWPSTEADIVGSLAAGESITAEARLASGEWLRVRLPEGGTAWAAAYFTAAADLDSLPVVDADAPAWAPMQAFTFQTGLGDSPCVEAPQSGLLIQTPDGVDAVTLQINGAVVEIGSTGFFQAEADAGMRLYLLEGQAAVTVGETRQEVPAGTVLRLPLDENMAPAGPPEAPQPFDPADLGGLPLALLDRPVAVGEEVGCGLTVAAAVTTHDGPGAAYAVAGELRPDVCVSPVGFAQSADGDVWWRLVNGQWVDGAAVDTLGGCDDLPALSVPTVVPPTAAPSGWSGGLIWLHLDSFMPCVAMAGGASGTALQPVPLGATVRLSIGQGFPDQAAAEAARASDSMAITINGQAMPSFLTDVQYDSVGNYTYWRQYDWTPSAPGVYSVVGVSEHHGTVACTVTVE